VASERRPTSTSSFGVSRRESHDASDFYARFEAPELSDSDDVDPTKEIDEIFCGDARSMTQVPTNSVALVVTSPPYFAGKEYEEALGEGLIPATYLEYLKMLEDVFAECVRTLEPGGRIAVNVANLGRRPYRSLSSDVIDILQNKLHLLLRGEVVWQKARGAGGSCAWGSFQRPANPVLRDLTERIVIASKGRFDRALSATTRELRKLPHKGSMSRDEFMEATTDVWEIPPESATRVGHPAPFPVELPERLIHLNTYYGDLVLDPFMGSGTTAVAAVRRERHFVGYDMDATYVAQARQRVADERARLARSGMERRHIVLPSPVMEDADDADFQRRAVEEGRAARQIARSLLDQCGFKEIEANKKLPSGVEVNFVAWDQTGREWHFDVSGGFTSTRPGLKRSDTFWKALGKAAVLHEAHPNIPLVLLTTDLPTKHSAQGKALEVVRGDQKPIQAVLEMDSSEDQALLTRWAEQGPPSNA
jgi:modification methylase